MEVNILHRNYESIFIYMRVVDVYIGYLFIHVSYVLAESVVKALLVRELVRARL